VTHFGFVLCEGAGVGTFEKIADKTKCVCVFGVNVIGIIFFVLFMCLLFFLRFAYFVAYFLNALFLVLLLKNVAGTF
jgi:hypothetical protein